LLWRYWQTAAFSLIIPALAAIASLTRAASLAQSKLWLLSLNQAIAESALPGAINDATPASFFSYHLLNTAAILGIWITSKPLITALSWLLLALFLSLYFRGRTANQLQDIAFFCPLLLIPVYHRYYDAQLLLGILPFLTQPASPSPKTKAAIWVCLLLLLFPLQAIFAAAFPALNPASLSGFILLRHQPVLILLLCALLTA
jgi:hypothetical protein